MTIDQFKRRLKERGVTIGQWADTHGFDRLMVYRTLAGTIKGHYGKGHEILVAAGVKPQATDREAA